MLKQILRAFQCAACCLVLLSSVSARAETVELALETSLGDITVELYEDKAPITVANFLRYIDAKSFDGGNFYRVVRMDNQVQNDIKIEVIQGGRNRDDATAQFEAIPLERTNLTGIKHEDGTISMARGGPDTATSEFFICVGAQPSLDFGGMRNSDGQGFAAFGKVTQGMDIVRAIQAGETVSANPDALEFTSGQSLVEPVEIIHFRRK